MPSDKASVAEKEQIRPTVVAGETIRLRGQSRGLSRSIRRFLHYKPGVAALAFILLLSAIALFADVIAPYPPAKQYLDTPGKGPSIKHPLGVDHLGRDVLSRVIYGTRVALLVGLLATGIAVTVGVAIGLVAGYFGGWMDSLLSRLTDAIMAFPLLALLLALAVLVGPGLVTTVVIIGLTIWAPYARVARAEVLSLREREFVLAARALGASSIRIILRHLLPNIVSPIIVLATLGIGSVIIFESALSFLGLGVQPPTPAWGSMLSDSRAYLRYYPHLAIAPGVMIALTVMAFNLLGDGLRDMLDPRMGNER